jgi:uncharacterized protein YecE (DUF72 family)
VRGDNTIKIGCCGWAEAQQKYYQEFDIVEVQETFYQPGWIGKYEKWRCAAPLELEFTVKACKLITHEQTSPTYRKLKFAITRVKKNCYGFFRPTQEVFAAWAVTDMITQALDARMILSQSPPSFAPLPENKRNLRTFFKTIHRRGYLLCWEPRGDWQDKDIKRICSNRDLVHCVDPFKSRPMHGGVHNFRLHGRPGYNLRYRYRKQDLQDLLGMVSRKTAYVLFNNLSMLHDAKLFQRLVE